MLALSVQSAASFPPLGVIDFYGLRSVPEQKLRQSLPFREGDAIDPDQFTEKKPAIEKQLANIPGVKQAFMTLVCCTDDQKSIVYVGIEEISSPCLSFRPAPTGAVRLPEDVLQAGRSIDAAWEKAVLSGNNGEDDSQGRALSDSPELRAEQLKLIALADRHFTQLRDVLQNSSVAEQRALAAQVLGYVQNKQSVVPDLMAALKDPDPGVRNNATRTLVVFERFSPPPGTKKIEVPFQPIVGLLNSCVWTDRNKSSAALAELSESRPPALLKQLQQDALPSLVEMARWKYPGHAWSSIVILGRIGGLTDDEIQKDVDQGKREAVIRAAAPAQKK